MSRDEDAERLVEQAVLSRVDAGLSPVLDDQDLIRKLAGALHRGRE